MATKQYSYFFIRGYFKDSEHVQRALEAIGYRHYAYILHDKDVWTVDSEEHHKGDLKKPHWHICVNLIQKTSWNVVRARIQHACGFELGLRVEDIHDVKESFDYLIHESKHSIDSGKHRYELSEVHSDKLSYWSSDDAIEQNNSEKQDFLMDFIDEVLELGYCPVFLLFKYKSLAKMNFIMKYESCLRYCARCLSIDVNLIYTSPENRFLDEAHLQENK